MYENRTMSKWNVNLFLTRHRQLDLLQTWVGPERSISLIDLFSFLISTTYIASVVPLMISLTWSLVICLCLCHLWKHISNQLPVKCPPGPTMTIALHNRSEVNANEIPGLNESLNESITGPNFRGLPCMLNHCPGRESQINDLSVFWSLKGKSINSRSNIVTLPSKHCKYVLRDRLVLLAEEGMCRGNFTTVSFLIYGRFIIVEITIRGLLFTLCL